MWQLQESQWRKGGLREELRLYCPAGLPSKPGSITYSDPRIVTQHPMPLVCFTFGLEPSLVTERLQEDDIENVAGCLRP